MVFIFAAAALVFLFGLSQWARSGVILWDIFKFSKSGAVKTEDYRQWRREQETEDRVLRRMERSMDELLRSSLRVLGVLALFVWIFVMVSVVVDMLGLDWLERLSFTSNRVLGDPTVRSGVMNRNSNPRNNTLRSLGSGVRR